MSNGTHLDWVLTNKIAEMSGYSVGALNKLRQRGHVAMDVHWKKNRIGRVIWNVERFNEWQSSQELNPTLKVA